MMKKTLAVAALITSLSVLADGYSEKNQYLGVVNGQVVGNSVVKVVRTPTDPVLYRSGSNESQPEELVVRHAESRPASGGLVNITVKQTLGDGRDVRLTLKSVLMVDGKKAAIVASQRGDNVVIAVPMATRQVELRTDAPAELEIPANYRGNIQVSVEVVGRVS